MKKNILRIGLLLGISFALCACSGVKPLGSVGSTKFYSVHSSHLFSPNYNFLVTSNGDAVTVNQGFGGAPVSGQVVGAAIQGASVVGGAYMLGSHWPKPVGDNISAGSDSTSAANSGTGAVTATGGTGSGGQKIPPGHINNPSHNN